MRNKVRVLTASLILVAILIVSLTGTVLASGGPNPEPGVCPNPDCPGECQNSGDGSQTQSQVCTATCNQKQFNNQYGAEGNCNSKKHCKTNQYMWGVEAE